MRYLLITKSCEGLGLLWRLRQEGNLVEWVAMDEYYNDTYKNIAKQVTLNEGLRDKNVVIIFDHNRDDGLSENLKQSGYMVFGGGMGWIGKVPTTELLEHDRKWALQFCDRLEIPQPDWKYFANPMDGISFLQGNEDRWVLKPVGAASCDMTFPSKDNLQLVALIKKYVEEKKLTDFVLQKFVEGTEISCEVYVSDGKILMPPNATLETKKFLNDDKGENTGCSNSICWFFDKRPKLFDDSLAKLEKWLWNTGYCGTMDANGIIDKYGRYNFLEFTPRLGWSSTYACLPLFNDEVGKVLYDVASGNASDMSVKQGFGSSIRVSVPPYPFEPGKVISTDVHPFIKKLGKDYENEMGHAVYNKSNEIPVNFDMNDPNIIPLDVYYNPEDRQIKTSGNDGVVLEVLGYGQTISEASESAYNRLSNISIPNAQFRTDIANNAQGRLNKLMEIGYLGENVKPIEVKGIMQEKQDMINTFRHFSVGGGV